MYSVNETLTAVTGRKRKDGLILVLIVKVDHATASEHKFRLTLAPVWWSAVAHVLHVAATVVALLRKCRVVLCRTLSQLSLVSKAATPPTLLLTRPFLVLGVVSGIYIFKPLVDDGTTGSALGGQQNSKFVIQCSRKIEYLTLPIRSTVDHSEPGLTALDRSRAGDRDNQTVHRHTER